MDFPFIFFVTTQSATGGSTPTAAQIDAKLQVLSLRCQSLLYLKLFKMKRHEVNDFRKLLTDYHQKVNPPLTDLYQVLPSFT